MQKQKPGFKKFHTWYTYFNSRTPTIPCEYFVICFLLDLTHLIDINAQEGLTAKPRQGSKASWWKQLITLTQRSFVNMSRDVGYYWMKMVVNFFLAACIGSIFFDIGTEYKSIYARGACGAFIASFMTFMTIGGFPSFVEELKVK